jgi:hypothetical protein
MSGNISLMEALILYRAHDWFFNPSLKPILQDSSVWFQLGRVTHKYSDSLPHFRLGEDAAKIAEWKPVIHEDLSTWITEFIAETDHLQFNVSPKVFVSVIRSIWVAESSDMMKCLDARNESWVLARSIGQCVENVPIQSCTCPRMLSFGSSHNNNIPPCPVFILGA